MSKNYRYATWSYLTKNILKKMRSHCVKCKKCARTAPNAKKCGACGKNQKVRDFCVANNRIFPQGVYILHNPRYNFAYSRVAVSYFDLFNTPCKKAGVPTEYSAFDTVLSKSFNYITMGCFVKRSFKIK